MMRVTELADGTLVHGSFGDPDVADVIREHGPYQLVIADPPYGKIVPHGWDRTPLSDSEFAQWMTDWCEQLQPVIEEGGALYVWGGIGKPGFRPFYKFLTSCEESTEWNLANHITWKKKRAYGVQHNYLFTREELAYFVLGNTKKPKRFQVPYLDEKRGYAGYNAKYPAKSEYLRRTSVWTDVTEIMRGKEHPCEKPSRLAEIVIDVHTVPGDIVLDPFAGSASTALAARKMGRRFLIIEEDAQYHDLCLRRLKDETE